VLLRQFVKIAEKLKPGGIFHLATDWENYAQHMLRVMRQAPGFENLAADDSFVPRPANRPTRQARQMRAKNRQRKN